MTKQCGKNCPKTNSDSPMNYISRGALTLIIHLMQLQSGLTLLYVPSVFCLMPKYTGCIFSKQLNAAPTGSKEGIHVGSSDISTL